MHVTIIADASYCPDTSVGGYGYWIASDLGKLGGGGVFRDPVENSISAEMLAVCNALHVAMERALFAPDWDILFQTDCMAAIQAFTGARETRVHQEVTALQYMRRIALTYGLTYRFKHVKGHTNHKEGRFAANRLCDKYAKDGMRLARQSAKSGAIKELGLGAIL